MGLYAVEKDRTYGTKNRVCVKGDEGAQFSGTLPGVRDQCQDGVQVEGALFARGDGRNGGAIAPAQKQPGATAGRGSVRDCAFEVGALVLGTAQDSGAVFAWSWRGGE